MLPSSREVPSEGGLEAKRQQPAVLLPPALGLLTLVLPQVRGLLGIPRNQHPSRWPLAPGGAQPLHQSLAVRSLRPEATAPHLALHPPRRAAHSSSTTTFLPSGH
jgi:hypothetical protein